MALSDDLTKLTHAELYERHYRTTQAMARAQQAFETSRQLALAIDAEITKRDSEDIRKGN